MPRTIIILLFSSLLQACGTTQPGDAAGITYHLPKTHAKISLSIDVLKCDRTRPGVTIESSLSVDAVAHARKELYSVAGSDLNSSTIKRSLTISVDDNGVISSINSANSDQRAAIIGNLVKIGATAVAAIYGAVPDPKAEPTLGCSEKAAMAYANLEAAQTALSRLPLSAPGKHAIWVDTQKQVDALATLIAGYKSVLHKDLSREIDITKLDSSDIDVEFPREALSELFNTYSAGSKTYIKGITDDSIKLFTVTASLKRDAPPSNALSNVSDNSLKACRQSILLPNAGTSTITATPTGSIFKTRKVETVSKSLPTSQLYPDRTLCLSTRFGENRTVSLKLDKFGRVTEFMWVSDAQLANITAAVAGVAPDASATYEGIRDIGVARDKAELTRLQTEQSLRKARQCQAILDAGGTQCP